MDAKETLLNQKKRIKFTNCNNLDEPGGALALILLILDEISHTEKNKYCLVWLYMELKKESKKEYNKILTNFDCSICDFFLYVYSP